MSNLKDLNKVKTEKEKRREAIYKHAQTGDKNAMQTLRDEFDYMAITVKGKVVILKEI